ARSSAERLAWACAGRAATAARAAEPKAKARRETVMGFSPVRDGCRSGRHAGGVWRGDVASLTIFRRRDEALFRFRRRTAALTNAGERAPLPDRSDHRRRAGQNLALAGVVGGADHAL